MLKTLIHTQVSTKELTYRPGGSPGVFEVVVVNQSTQFATFQVDIQAPGTQESTRWYSLSPEISTKKPPGDRTQFSVQIIDNPKPGFIGLINLTVRIFSLELRQEERHILRLRLEAGTGLVPLKVALPVRTFQGLPEELIEIPVELENPDHLPAEVIVRCQGLSPDWFTEGLERRLRLKAEGLAKTSFFCRIPSPTQALSQIYPFSIAAHRPDEPATQAEGSLVILPTGEVDFSCTPTRQQIPQRRAWLPNWRANQAIYQVQFTNRSNLPQQAAIAITSEDKQLDCQFQVVPEQADVPVNQTTQQDLRVTKRRRWFGLPRTYQFAAKAQLADSRLNVKDDTQFLRLVLYPVIPLWLQILSVSALLYLLWWASWLNPRNPFWGHKAPVNSVQFNGVADKLVSGSKDQSMIAWRSDGFENTLINQNIGTIGKTQKSVRVVRYRPVNNDLVAAGLENGEIQLWNPIPGDSEPLQSFANQPDDRVFALAFTPDARSLFSGHGSGLVVQWHLDPDIVATQPTKQRQKQVGFAINALGLVGEAGTHLAIAGRFNQLALWDLQTDRLRSVKYGSGSAANYILSLATASRKPYLLASADNQGTIKIWNLRPCLTGTADCQLVDEWNPDKAIYSVAFTADGCYLASGGDDGRVVLWSLNAGGDRWQKKLDGETLDRSQKSINSVDTIRVKDEILVISGGDDTQVNFYRVKQSGSDCR